MNHRTPNRSFLLAFSALPLTIAAALAQPEVHSPAGSVTTGERIEKMPEYEYKINIDPSVMFEFRSIKLTKKECDNITHSANKLTKECNDVKTALKRSAKKGQSKLTPAERQRVGVLADRALGFLQRAREAASDGKELANGLLSYARMDIRQIRDILNKALSR